jgi:hypothetical protein
MSNEESKKKTKTGGTIIACIVAIIMGVRFIVKGIGYYQIDYVRTNGMFLLICGILLVVLAIVIGIRGFIKNSKKDE